MRQKFLILSLLCVAPDKTSSVCVVVTQLCPTLCDPIFGSLSDSSVHGIPQARIPEWVAISFSTVPSKYLVNELLGKLAHIYEDWLIDICIFRVTSCWVSFWYVEQVGLKKILDLFLTYSVLIWYWFSPFRQTVCHNLLVVPVRSQSFDVLQTAVSKHLVNTLKIFFCYTKSIEIHWLRFGLP